MNETIDYKYEYLHPCSEENDPALTETTYFGFESTEARLTGEIYIWFHPVLRVVSAGVWVWKGLKSRQQSAEYYDYQAFLPYPEFGATGFRTHNGLAVEVIEPLVALHVRYVDPGRQFAVDLRFDALHPPVSRPRLDFEAQSRSIAKGGFEQVMHTHGMLTLGGEPHAIDGYTIRDRSWGQVRPETAFALPPFTWMTASAGPAFSFCLSAYDDPALKPEWLEDFAAPPHNGFGNGWVNWQDRTRRIVKASKLTKRNGVMPISHRVTMEDEDGRVFACEGEVLSNLPFSPWPNMAAWCGLTRWTCDGTIAWGHTQECQWPQYLSRFDR